MSNKEGVDIVIKFNPLSSVCKNMTATCPECKKGFSTSGNMKNHYLTIHKNIRPFKCKYAKCSKQYSNQSRLEVHLRTHTGEKPFKCSVCSKSFNERGNLKTHLAFHTNLRPFKCPNCSKTYKTNGHLKDHIEIQHYKLRRFTCNVCNFKFGKKSTLVTHMKIHSLTKPIKEICNGLQSKPNLNSNLNNNRMNILETLENNSTVLSSSSNLNANSMEKRQVKKQEMEKADINGTLSMESYFDENHFFVVNQRKDSYENLFTGNIELPPLVMFD